ncbi:hypothetical protein FJTKL_15112 [Diaporthe vaccinii]|uniref:Tat pathway signal sequence n=1 Tax=Diaporthe vaccinii TaxID=105482 RepID=A0ABR4E5W6_9PEZI
MFGAFKKHHQSDDAAGSDEEETFLPKSNSKIEATARRSSWTDHVWKATTLLFAILFVMSLFLPRPLFQPRDTYETGFDTDLEPAVASIKMQRTKFAGGIIVNDSDAFELVLDQGAPQYTGHPSQKLDDNWDRLVGGYIALTQAEAAKIQGEVSVDGGSYFVVPHVRHSLHCVNYLRKVAYEKWYPTIRTENKPTVPTFWQHVDHCIETLRHTVQCQSDLTPVPHVWSEGKQMYLADTSLEHTCRNYDVLMDWQDRREDAFKAKTGHK